MKIAFVMPFYADPDASPETVLDRYPITRLLPEAVCDRGHEVCVLLHSPINETIRINGVTFEFLSAGTAIDLAGNILNKWKPRYGPAYYQPAWRIARRLRQLKPDVVHFFGMTLDIQLALMTLITSRYSIPVFVHYHGGLPDGSSKLHHLQRRNFQRINMALFTSLEQSLPWIQAGLLSAPSQVGQLMETSSPFTGMNREMARTRTGMYGAPVCLSAGRLHPIKDPITVLRGFRRIIAVLPEARLYCYYLTSEMKPEIDRLLASDDFLSDRVELRGKAPLSEMEAIYSSADFLLQASTREWSGIAVLEAMSTGCIPIVTRIPSFEEMTCGGRYGKLFDIGDDAALAQAVVDLDQDTQRTLSREVKDYFEEWLSFPALARKLEQYYHEALS